MCGRFSLQRANIAELRERFGFEEFHERTLPPAIPRPGPAPEARPLLQPRFNIAPAQPILTVHARPTGRQLEPALWGFRPAWLTRHRGPPPINAQAETLAERPLWKGALRSGRCLVPADGFYEWAAAPGRKTKQPYHLRLRESGLFAIAGLLAWDADGNPTCALVTTTANDLVAPIHARMPAILRPEDEAAWLDRDERNPAALLGLLAPYPPEAMEAVPVSPLVGDVRNDGPELLAPL